ncbi:MAG: proC [Bacillales bacterium]|jgi:pyrroline-5-carboxylate reductase|nr:proC [Bacillales bacterium]
MKKLAIIGAGSMAEALIVGLIKNNLINNHQVYVTNNSNQKRLTELQKKYGVIVTYDPHLLLNEADIIVLAVKPKDAENAIIKIKHLLTSKMLIISLLAGVLMETIENISEKKLSIVRAMPNTSAAIGRSATAIAFNSEVTATQKSKVKIIFDTLGITRFVEEKQLDAVTGLSGSGPAYIYYLAEAMEKSAVEIGLDRDLAKELIVQTLLGAAEMLTKTTKTTQELRKAVTSPGGTTEAGIKILSSYNVQRAFIECIKEATAQSERLGHGIRKNDLL